MKITKALREEIKEVKSLTLTQEDLDQAEKIADILIQAVGQYGIALLPLKPLIKKAIAYGLRDIKEGVKAPEKLLIKRIIKEFKSKS